MNHHAYVLIDAGEDIQSRVITFLRKELHATHEECDHVVMIEHTVLSVDDARALNRLLQFGAYSTERRTFFVIATHHINHEAQNALLKSVEEPPAGCVLLFVLPSEGELLPTMRSRVHIVTSRGAPVPADLSLEFIKGTEAKRSAILDRIMLDLKSDSQDKKEEARTQIARLLADLEQHVVEYYREKPTKELKESIKDIVSFLPLVKEKGAPFKLMLEHLKLIKEDIPR